MDQFRRVWAFIASIVLESEEAYANDCGTQSAMEALRQAPLMEVKPSRKTPSVLNGQPHALLPS